MVYVSETMQQFDKNNNKLSNKKYITRSRLEDRVRNVIVAESNPLFNHGLKIIDSSLFNWTTSAFGWGCEHGGRATPGAWDDDPVAPIPSSTRLVTRCCPLA